MMMTGKEFNALATLLRFAKEGHAALRQDLNDLTAARNAAERSLAQPDDMMLAPASENRAARQRRLVVMLATYDEAEAKARDKLDTAIDRARRLEGLLGSAGARTQADTTVSFARRSRLA